MPIPIHGKQYLTVAERIAAATETLPVGVVKVESTFIQFGTASLCRATVTFKDGQSYTGHAEVPVDSRNPAERDAPHECAETSAVGRALAMAGYAGSESGLAGAEEVQRPPRRPQAAAVERGFPPTPPDEEEPPHFVETERRYGEAPPRGPNAGVVPATPKQLQTIQRMARAQGKPIPTENLTRAQASEIISRLIGEADARQ